MKKIAILMTGLIIAATSFAQYGNGNYGGNYPYGNNNAYSNGYGTSQLAITTSGGYYRVNLDGRQFNVDPNGVTLNVGAGTHSIQIYRMDNNYAGGGILGGLFGSRRTQMVYNNSVYVNNGQRIDLMVNNNGRVRTRETNLGNNNWNGRRRERDDD